MKYNHQQFDNTIMPSGLTLIGERMPSYRSVAVGIWVRSGSVGEKPDENGFSHFIEHMLFKGTTTRTARDIAEAMDAIGGQMNAFTSKECTCFYIKVLGEHLEQAVDLLSDLVLNATLDAGEMEKERGVILEEISMVEDTPEDLVHELLAQAHFGGTPLAMPILGPAENISDVSRDRLNSYRLSRYLPRNSVMSVAGDYDWDHFQGLASQYLAGWSDGGALPRAASADGNTRGRIIKSKDIEQMHLCIGYPGLPQDSDDVYALAVLNGLLGGGMSSRLFQRIREERGLAYSVYTYPASFASTGLFTVYAGINPKNGKEVVEIIAEELRNLKKGGITDAELTMNRDQLKGGFVMGQESTSARMSAVGKARLLLDRVLTEQQVIDKINAVTREDVMRVAEGVFSMPFSASIIARDPETDLSPLEGAYNG